MFKSGCLIYLFLIFVIAFQAFGYEKLNPILRSSDRAASCRSFYYGYVRTSTIRHLNDLIMDIERPHATRLLDSRRAFYHYEKYQSKLSPDTLQAINNYKGMGYIPINRLLRSGKPLAEEPDLAKQILKIDRAIDESPPLPSNIVLYRGIQLSDPSRISLEKGSQFSDAGFISTSLTAKTAAGFATNSIGTMPNAKTLQIVQVIHVLSKKIRGLYLDSEGFNMESEVLIDRQSRFRVLRSQWVVIENHFDGAMGIGVFPIPDAKPPLITSPPLLEQKQEQLELFPLVKKPDPEQQELFPEIALPKSSYDPTLDPNNQFLPISTMDPTLPINIGSPFYPGSMTSPQLPIFNTSNSVPTTPYKILIQHLEVIQD